LRIRTSTKKRILVAWLVLFAIWPLAHRVIVARYDTSPWKLFGWAMYVQPTLPATLRITGLRQGEEVQLDASRLPGEAAAALEDFRNERVMLGDLRPPNDVGEALLEEVPDLSRVTIVVHRMRIHPDSDRIGVQIRRYDYGR